MERQISHHRHLVHPIRGSCTAAPAKVLFETPYQVAPHPTLDPQPFQDRKLFCWDLVTLIRSTLPPRPIEPLPAQQVPGIELIAES